MTEHNKEESEREQERQEQEVDSDMEIINQKTITPVDIVKDAVSTMQREEILEPYDTAGNSRNEKNQEEK